MRDWKNLVLSGLTLVLIIVVVMWFMGWGSASVQTTASVDTAKPAVSAGITAQADTTKGALAPQSNQLAQPQPSAPMSQLPLQGPMAQSQASPPAPMGQLPQQEEQQEVYNPALVPVVPPPAAPPGKLPTEKKEWEASRDMLFDQLSDQQAPRETRVRAARALGSFPTAGVAQFLETVMLTDKDPVVRFTAAQAIGLTGSRRSCAGLARSMQMDTDNQVRQVAEKSLGMIKARNGLPPSGALTFQKSRDNRPTSPQPVPSQPSPPAPAAPSQQAEQPTPEPALFIPDRQSAQQDDGQPVT
jgi:hypothetical protein